MDSVYCKNGFSHLLSRITSPYSENIPRFFATLDVPLPSAAIPTCHIINLFEWAVVDRLPYPNAP